MNLAIPLQDRGNGFDDLGVKGEQCEVKVRNLVDAPAGFGKLQFQWHGRLRFYCTNTRIPYKSLTFLRQLILSPMQFTSGIARLIHVGHPTLRNPRSIWAIYHLVIFLPPSFPSLLSPSYSNSDSNNNSNTMATLSPLLLPPRRPSGGDSAGARLRDASAARLYALSNVFRAPCSRCRRNKLICWGAIVPTGGTPRSCGDCLTAGKGKDCDVPRDPVSLSLYYLRAKADNKVWLEWSSTGDAPHPSSRRPGNWSRCSASQSLVPALAAWSSSWVDRRQHHFAPPTAATAATGSE